MQFLRLSTRALLAMVLMSLFSCAPSEDAQVIRIGHAPNLTHVQALVARHMSREGKGWFERYVPEQRIEWRLYQGGPSSMEAIFSRAVDLSYVGPSPAINAYSVSQGQELQFLSGAVNGGSSLLIGPQSKIQSAADFKTKTIATPQLGNTQDVTCRAWMQQQGLSNTLEGKGDVRIAPSPNSMQAQLLKDGSIDACWTVEPWVSTIAQQTGAQIFLDEPEAVTTILVGRKRWLDLQPELAQRMLQAHQDLTAWILAHPEEAQQMVADELSILTQSPTDIELIRKAWSRLTLSHHINCEELENFVQAAQALKLLGPVPPVKEMIAPILQPQLPSPPHEK